MNYDEYSAAEAESRRRKLQNFIDDLGELKSFFNDPAITDIKVVDTGEIIVERFAKGKEFTGIFLDSNKVKGVILSASVLTGKNIVFETGLPKLECVLPKPNNFRFTGILPPAVEHAQIAMRRPPAKIFTLEDYLEKGQLQQNEYELICQYIKDRKNILIGGSTGSGKTTFTNAVLHKMVEYTPDDSFYIVEDVPELQCEARDKTMLSITKDSAAEAVRTALRWTPNRIIFGEVRYGEVADELIKSWNTGHTGNVTTIHADSAESMIKRMEDILHEVIKEHIPDLSQVIHLCVHLTKTAKGRYVDQVIPVKAQTQDFMSVLRENNLLNGK